MIFRKRKGATEAEKKRNWIGTGGGITSKVIPLTPEVAAYLVNDEKDMLAHKERISAQLEMLKTDVARRRYLNSEKKKFNDAAAWTKLIQVTNAEQIVEWIDRSARPRLKQPVIAYKYVYLKIAKLHEGINESNMDAIAAEYGWTSPHSGRAILDQFKIFDRDERNRILPAIADPEDAGYNRSQLALIANLKKVIEQLEEYPEAKTLAQLELKKAKKI